MSLIRVMLVDDEAIVRDGLRSCIDWEANGFSVETLEENGARALAYMEKDPVDLVVTDIKMPVLDGLELIRQSKEADYPAKFLILSGYDDFAYAQKALRYGADDYI